MDLFKKGFIKSVLFGTLISAAAITALLLIASVILFKSGIFPKDYLLYIILCVLAVSGFFGGFISGRFNKSAGLLTGAVTGGVVFLVVLIAGLINSPSTITLATLYKLTAIVFPSMLGGVVGVNKAGKIKI